jgi:hypothetical protein
MTDFLAAEDRALLERHGLGTFEALWAKQLDAVDEPNTGRGGWSSVFRLDLEGHGYYLKRQSNYLTRTLRAPFGEPSFAREFRNISRYRKIGIPALEAAFYGERKVDGEVRAILLTRALDGWDDLDSLLQRWNELSSEQHSEILKASGELARQLHCCTAGAWLLLSQAHFHACLRHRLSGAIDRPGKDPAAAVRAARPNQGPGAADCAARPSGASRTCGNCWPPIWTNRRTAR